MTVRTLLEGVRLRDGGLLTLLLFLLTRPYIGIQHDARLYVGYALAKLDPNGIGQDLVFTADGQSGYSIFPPIFLQIVKWLGPETAAMAVPVVGLVLWFVVFRRFVARVLPSTWSPELVNAAMILSFSVTSYYGGTGVLRFAEPYATPRIFAEACVLLSLALMLMRSRWYLAALAVAIVVHPLMSAPSVGVVVLSRVAPRWRGWLLASVVISLFVVAGATYGLKETSGLLAQFDSEWRRVLDFKRTLTFLRYWNPQDFARTVIHVVTAIMAWRCFDTEVRRLLQAIIAVAALGLVATGIAADLAGNVLLTQVQPWRGLWLLAVMATLALPVLLQHVWGKEHVAASTDLQKIATMLIVLAWLLTEVSGNAWVPAVSALVLWHMSQRGSSLSLSSFSIRVVGGVVAAVVLGATVAQLYVATGVAWSSPDIELRRNWNYWYLSGLPGFFLFVGSLLVLLRRVRMPHARVMAGATLLVAVFGVAKFDARTRYQRFLEHSLAAYIRTGAPIVSVPSGSLMWAYTDLEPWAFAGRATWGSVVQGIPSVFSRELALEWARRWAALGDAGLLPDGETSSHMIATAPERPVESLGRLCSMQGAPATIIVPAQSSAAVGRVFGLTENKLLQPLVRGEAWGMIGAWKIHHCVNGGMHAASQ